MGSRWSRRFLARGVVACAVIAVLVSACSGGNAGGNAGAGVARPVSGGTLTIRGTRDFDTWDPATCTTCREYASVFYATLLAIDGRGKVVPYLARSYTATATSITFKLRTDATCSDGTRVTPEVVKNSLQRMIDVKAPNNAALFGPGPYSVSADDANDTVTFSVGTPFSDLVYGFTQLDPGRRRPLHAGRRRPRRPHHGPAAFRLHLGPGGGDGQNAGRAGDHRVQGGRQRDHGRQPDPQRRDRRGSRHRPGRSEAARQPQHRDPAHPAVSGQPAGVQPAAEPPDHRPGGTASADHRHRPQSGAGRPRRLPVRDQHHQLRDAGGPVLRSAHGAAAAPA